MENNITRRIRRRRKLKRRSDSTGVVVKNIEKGVNRSIPPTAPVEFLSSNCIPLNLALSQKGRDGGWPRARVSNIIGDGSSGKTLLALELAFWFFNNYKKLKSNIFAKIKKLIIKYDNGEGVMDFPMPIMYGKEFSKFVDWERSKSFEQMCRRFLKLAFNLKKGESLLYIIDSWDSFQGSQSKKDFRDSIEKDNDLKGDYDLFIQKYASRKFFPAFCDALDKNKVDATLIIISQVRGNVGVTFGKKLKRSGGKALDFYTHSVVEVAEKRKLRKKKLGESKVYAIESAVRVTRSKVAKPFREAEFRILYDYGMDNINSMINYLWGQTKKKIKFDGEEFSKTKNLVRYIEKNNLEDKIINMVEDKWQKVERAFTDEVKKRKPRY